MFCLPCFPQTTCPAECLDWRHPPLPTFYPWSESKGHKGFLSGHNEWCCHCEGRMAT